MRLAALVLTLAACGGGGTTVDAPPIIDTAPLIDAPPPTVFKVICPATPDATIATTAGVPFAYMPTTAMIPLNGVVQFVMTPIHDAEANTMMSDTGLRAPYNATTCLMFTKQGTFGFHCGMHLFQGTITVQ
jgi:plastocyanin